jgi:rod shape-determining protein MreB
MIIKNNEGIVLYEPTVIAISKKNKKIVAIGSDAKKILGRENRSIVAKRPLQNGGISNYKLAYALLEKFLDQVLGRYRFANPDVVVSVPSKLNSIEERALIKALESYGVNKKILFPEPLAAALGAALPIEKPIGNMIINIGGGTAEIAIISSNDIVTSSSFIGAGDEINKNIVELVKNEFNLEIGEETAESIKFKIASALKTDEPRIMHVSGKNIDNSQSLTIAINSNHILPAIRVVLDNIANETKKVINQTSAELISDITENGIAISGGTAEIKDIDKYFTKVLNIPCFIVEEPISSVVRGLWKYVQKKLA